MYSIIVYMIGKQLKMILYDYSNRHIIGFTKATLRQCEWKISLNDSFPLLVRDERSSLFEVNVVPKIFPYSQLDLNNFN